MACRLLGTKPFADSVNASLLNFGPLETNISEVLIKMQTFSFKKIHLQMSSVKWSGLC